jgi:hypothetical protein
MPHHVMIPSSPLQVLEYESEYQSDKNKGGKERFGQKMKSQNLKHDAF